LQARRQQQRNKLSNEADRIQALLLQSLAKEKVVQQALGKNAELLLKSPIKRPPQAKKNDEDDLFNEPLLAHLSRDYGLLFMKMCKQLMRKRRRKQNYIWRRCQTAGVDACMRSLANTGGLSCLFSTFLYAGSNDASTGERKLLFKISR